MKKIFLGISRHPKRFLLAILFGYATLWTALEPLFAILEIKTTGYNCYYLIGYLLVSFIIALVIVYPKSKVKFDLNNTNTKVEIEFGDLFTSNGHKVIPVNDFFDSEIGQPVSPVSLHGIFINRVLGGHSQILDSAVSAQLSNSAIGTVQRIAGKTQKYPLGTTITIPHNNDIYFAFALANSDSNCNASSSPELMMDALNGLWNNIRTNGNGIDVNLPLIGNGLSRIGVPPNQLLQIILISLLKSAKERDLSSTIRIILTEETFNKIDLEIIKNNWQ